MFMVRVCKARDAATMVTHGCTPACRGTGRLGCCNTSPIQQLGLRTATGERAGSIRQQQPLPYLCFGVHDQNDDNHYDCDAGAKSRIVRHGALCCCSVRSWLQIYYFFHQFPWRRPSTMSARLGDAFAAIKSELHPGSTTDKAIIDLLNRQS